MRRFPTLFLAVMICVGAATTPQADAVKCYSVAKASTRVGLARVVLELDGLAQQGDRLVGSYRITVPLAPMLNDRGTIRLDLADSLEGTVAREGVIRGSGHSELDGRTHTVTCAFDSEGGVRIRVDTGNRVLNFLSRLIPVS